MQNFWKSSLSFFVSHFLFSITFQQNFVISPVYFNNFLYFWFTYPIFKFMAWKNCNSNVLWHCNNAKTTPKFHEQNIIINFNTRASHSIFHIKIRWLHSSERIRSFHEKSFYVQHQHSWSSFFTISMTSPHVWKESKLFIHKSVRLSSWRTPNAAARS